MVIIDYFRARLFDWRRKQAIKKAQASADLYRKNSLSSFITDAPWWCLCRALRI